MFKVLLIKSVPQVQMKKSCSQQLVRKDLCNRDEVGKVMCVWVIRVCRRRRKLNEFSNYSQFSLGIRQLSCQRIRSQRHSAASCCFQTLISLFWPLEESKARNESLNIAQKSGKVFWEPKSHTHIHTYELLYGPNLISLVSKSSDFFLLSD